MYGRAGYVERGKKGNQMNEENDRNTTIGRRKRELREAGDNSCLALAFFSVLATLITCRELEPPSCRGSHLSRSHSSRSHGVTLRLIFQVTLQRELQGHTQG